jgi:hypothetical protein
VIALVAGGLLLIGWRHRARRQRSRRPAGAPSRRRAAAAAAAAAARHARARAPSGAARDASGNRRRVAVVETEPLAARPSLDDDVPATLAQLESDVFWIRLLEPIRRLPDGEADAALEMLAAQPLEHPHDGALLYEIDELRERLDWVRTTETAQVLERFSTLEAARSTPGPAGRDPRAAGMTLVELLVLFALMATALGIGAVYLKPIEAPVLRAAELTESALRSARARAVATLSAYRVRPATDATLTAEHASSCAAATWTAENALDLELPDGVTLADTAWSVCFNARGIASNTVVVTLDHPSFAARQVQVMLGGAVRIAP